MDEFDFIEGIAQSFGTRFTGPLGEVEGIGDDCAVIPVDAGWSAVMTTDMMVEDVHFIAAAVSPRTLGRKLLAVNLSDIASMGARPRHTTLTMGLPAHARGSWAAEFLEGYRELSMEHDVNLIGGDTTSSPDRIVLSVTAIGVAPAANIKRRSAARPGDTILVAGQLGGSAAGLADILAGNYDTLNARLHNAPAAQVREGVWLGSRPEVHAMMDLSDGLASDLPHILKRSGVSAEVETTRIPTTTTLENALCGGEDYKLLLTADPARADLLRSAFFNEFGTPLYPIGTITPDPTGRVQWKENGQAVRDAAWHGFTHF